MTNPVFFVDPAEARALNVGESYALGGAEGHHAATVKRLGPGETLDMVDGYGLRLSGTVESVGQGTLCVHIDRRLVESTSFPRLILVQALAKDGRDELAVETATELGVDAVIPWQADRSIVRWKADRLDKSLAKWRKTVLSATKQARRAWLPEVTNLLDSVALANYGRSSQLLVLHEQATTSLTAGLKELSALSKTEDLLVVVGPEGGISERELELFAAAGARQWRLGRHVLRSSTAGPAAISVLSEHLGRW